MDEAGRPGALGVLGAPGEAAVVTAPHSSMALYGLALRDARLRLPLPAPQPRRGPGRAAHVAPLRLPEAPPAQGLVDLSNFLMGQFIFSSD